MGGGKPVLSYVPKTNFCLFFQDDIIDSVEPFADAAALLKERGAYKVYVMVTHGILSGDFVRLIEESDIDEVIKVIDDFHS